MCPAVLDSLCLTELPVDMDCPSRLYALALSLGMVVPMSPSLPVLTCTDEAQPSSSGNTASGCCLTPVDLIEPLPVSTSTSPILPSSTGRAQSPVDAFDTLAETSALGEALAWVGALRAPDSTQPLRGASTASAESVAGQGQAASPQPSATPASTASSETSWALASTSQSSPLWWQQQRWMHLGRLWRRCCSRLQRHQAPAQLQLVWCTASRACHSQTLPYHWHTQQRLR